MLHVLWADNDSEATCEMQEIMIHGSEYRGVRTLDITVTSISKRTPQCLSNPRISFICLLFCSFYYLFSGGGSYLGLWAGPVLPIWILSSDTHSLVFISISHLSNLHISKQWDDKLCTLSLICRSLEWWRRNTDDSLVLQFHQVTEPPIGIFPNKRWTDSFKEP